MLQVHTSIAKLPLFESCALTIGTFDGVHLGHREVLYTLVAKARALKIPSVVITFEQHPRNVIYPDEQKVKQINTLSEKLIILQQLAIDHCVIVKFDDSFREQSATEYIHNFLCRNFHPQVIVIGYDHRFGKNKAGDIYLMKKELKDQCEIIEISPKSIDSIIMSSSKIRNAILSGDLARAADHLSYAYMLQGKVIHGDKRGRSMGFPTANIQPIHQHKIIPGNGAYIVAIQLYGEQYYGICNIGFRPTLSISAHSIEVHIFDFDKDIYKELITINFIKRIRDEMKFDNLEQLKNQLHKDKSYAIKYLAESAYVS